jgi:hypothetical protein
MRIKGLEPSLLAKPEPKSGASTNSAISAGNVSNHSTSNLLKQCNFDEIQLDPPQSTRSRLTYRQQRVYLRVPTKGTPTSYL